MDCGARLTGIPEELSIREINVSQRQETLPCSLMLLLLFLESSLLFIQELHVNGLESVASLVETKNILSAIGDSLQIHFSAL
jgi:hypothetical protein